MSEFKINIVEEFLGRTTDDVVGTVSFDLDDLPEDLNLPSKAWLAKRWRKWKAYQRVWKDICKAHENEELESVRVKLRSLTDPVDFVEYLLQFELDLKHEQSNTSKVGGEARSALTAPLRERARRIFQENKVAFALKKKSYSQRQFAEAHYKELARHYENRMQEIREGQAQLNRINDEIKLGELSASQLKFKREEKRIFEKAIRIKPSMPSIKTIEGWLAGL